MVAVTMVTIDCENPRELAEFWTAALGTEIAVDWEQFLVLKGEPAIAFQKVDDPTPGKNRIHLDLQSPDPTAEVARLVGVGATRIADHEMPGLSWVTLADPDGNQFCVSGQH